MKKLLTVMLAVMVCITFAGIASAETELKVDRKSVVQGKSVDLGGRRIIKKKKKGERKREREREAFIESIGSVRNGADGENRHMTESLE